jgi:predicted PurR-regulated permease PerM
VGLDFAIIRGFLAFVLNFIPNFGSIFSGIITTGFSIIQFWPDPVNMVIIGIIMLGVNMILGNVVEPRVQGRNLGLSPFLILASLSIWGWMWGFSGMILAVPMMAILKIICENVEMLKPISVLMGAPSTVREAERSQASEQSDSDSESPEKTQ